jgi:tRNA A37 threonylcarbamoyladenosine dehydratase
MSEFDTPDYGRRFGGVSRLYGQAALEKFQASHISVVGIGGVGSWAVEGLARNAVGKLTLIDLDNIAESNINRQLHALDGQLGMAKVSAMQARVKAINPACQVQAIEEFISADNVASLIPSDVDGVIDAVDDVKAKIALILHCRQHQIPIITTGGAGGRVDASRIQSTDLALVHGDRLLAKVRNQLRRDFGFPKVAQSGKAKPTKFGITAVYSDEPVQTPNQTCDADTAISGLNCAGYGSSVCVTAPFGFNAAGLMLNGLK